MANHYTLQWHGRHPNDRRRRSRLWRDFGGVYYRATEAREIAERQLDGGPEYRCVRILMEGDPLAWNDGRGWQDWHYYPEASDE